MAVAELDRESLANVKEESYLRVVWTRFKRHKLAVISTVMIIIIVVACALAPIIAPYDPTESQVDENGAIIKNAPPSSEFLMGQMPLDGTYSAAFCMPGAFRWWSPL